MTTCATNHSLAETILIHQLGKQSYEPVWQAMQQFTNTRPADQQDEIWLVEHDAVFTQGQAGKAEHVLAAGDIPVVQVDRGGQVTYHGPGQLVLYTLIDIRRKKLGVRDLVCAIEKSVIALLADHAIEAQARPDAPGVYVNNKKICSLGLRIRRGCSFHGLALNVDMDLQPFERINPCGYAGMQVTQMQQETQQAIDFAAIQHTLVQHFIQHLGYNSASWQDSLPNELKQRV